jgi:acetyl esterase/lipase
MADDRSVLTRAASPPDEVVAYGDNTEQIADVRFGDERAEQRPLMLIVHGGFWRPPIDRAHTGPMAEALVAAGWTVASAEYRRIPGDPDATLHDVGRAVEALPNLIGRHNGSAVLIGHSAGGHLVLWAAATSRVPTLAGTLALGPAADLCLAHELTLGDGAALAFLGTDPQSRADVDPRRLSSPERRTTIVHGEEDDIVPISLSESYVAAHPRTRLVRLPGIGHFAVIDPLSAAWPTVVQELQAITKTARSGT